MTRRVFWSRLLKFGLTSSSVASLLSLLSFGSWATFAQLEKMEVPAGYKVGQAGAGNDMDDSFANMVMAFGLAIAFIFMIPAAQFESYSEPFAIMFSLPLALIGALAGLFIQNAVKPLTLVMGI